MLSLHCLFLHHQLPLSTPPVSFINEHKTRISQSLIHGDYLFRTRKASSPCIAYAVEKDSQNFELDPDKAREALQELDQQLESLSRKKINSPKLKAPDMTFARTQIREDMPEISGSFLTYSAVTLFIFSIFYNVLFITVIKPAVDGPQIAPSASYRESQKVIVLQQLPAATDSRGLHSVLNL